MVPVQGNQGAAGPPGSPAELFAAFLSAADRAGVGLVLLQVAPALRATFVSARCSQILGRTVEEMLARPPLDLFPPEKMAEIGAILARHREGDLPPPTFEARVRRPDGRELALEFGVGATLVEGQPGSVIFMRDATEAVLAKETLRRSEARWRTVIEGAPDGVVISRRGIIRYANPAATALLGCERAEELEGASFQEFLPEEDLRKMMARVATLRPDGPAIGPEEYRARSRRGRELVVEVTSVLYEDSDGPAVLGFARDVTEHRRLQAQLIRADRLAALGTMAAGVAHEINNPLGFAQLALDSLEQRGPGPGAIFDEESRALLADIRHGVDRIAAVTGQLRTFSRRDQGSDTSTQGSASLQQVLANACRMVAREAQGRGRLECELGPLPAVRGDGAQLEQVFVNLLLNATQGLDPARSDGLVQLQATADDRRVVVVVRDDGAGIRNEDLARVFDPFFTTKPVGLGTGLGLFICHMILQRIGGEIAVESQLHRGTTVRVTLPIADPAEQPAPEAAPRPARQARLRILVMDDEQAILRLLERGLGGQHEVVPAATCAEAALALGDGDFDLVLLDLRMPDGGGLQLCEWLATKRPDLLPRVTFMTGGVSDDGLIVSGQAIPVLRKPFTIAALEALVDARSPP
jgi:PAS domain S-box-containing protein